MQAATLWLLPLSILSEMLITLLGNLFKTSGFELLLCPYLVSITLIFLLCLIYFYDAFGRLLSIAEETLAEFLSKATGTAVDWVQMPGMKVFILY